MTHECTGPCLDRRSALTAAAVAGVGIPFLAACGDDSASEPSTRPSGTVLTSTEAVPVGGGVILEEEKIVVVQPQAGEFKAFSSVCPHQGCQVSEVKDSEVICHCHASHFALEDGAPTAGPATQPLDEVRIKVAGKDIRLA
ncbi:Rieske 2Fe-2S domain-containing protein [Nocardioides sp. dk4132]|uniref:Rieske (2Fe-2S) protein n=1 Tax=unclassified Nocardioides TaxID=2615069 RepID=UPI00129799A5|nr:MULTISPECIES: Rieske (2Fe-2S) protein [unclassified Nocardioides]MQW75052.1 Rieske 2Fe-2S domain-containing protein [Nocardioides sp. dk4132]QGA07775.1 Rieske 2Fe-2S domain-containing protein [Nocardioides sp. dk884]